MKKPKAYIEKRTTFCGLDLYIDERVYVPTPETEILVDRAVNYIIQNNLQKGVIFDVGTGSGNIALALASKFHEAKIFAIDISIDALSVAQYNNDKHSFSNINFIKSDLVDELHLKPDLIIANLPWGDNEHLLLSNNKEELSFMPPIAVFAQDNLLGAYIRLCNQVQEKKWRTTLIIETGCISSQFIKEAFTVNEVIYVPIEYKKSQYSFTLLKPLDDFTKLN